MTDHQKDQLLDALMYYLPMDIRRQLMRELPEAYAAYTKVSLAAVHESVVEGERIRARQ